VAGRRTELGDVLENPDGLAAIAGTGRGVAVVCTPYPSASTGLMRSSKYLDVLQVAADAGGRPVVHLETRDDSREGETSTGEFNRRTSPAYFNEIQMCSVRAPVDQNSLFWPRV